MFWFNPSGSSVVGRDEKMLLDVLRIDLLPFKYDRTPSNAVERSKVCKTSLRWVIQTLTAKDTAGWMLLVIVLRIDFDREFLRSPECSESQADRSPFRLTEMVFNGSFQKRILECHHGNRRSPARMIWKEKDERTFRFEEDLLLLERIGSSLVLFKIEILVARRDSTVSTDCVIHRRSISLFFIFLDWLWKHSGRCGRHSIFPRRNEIGSWKRSSEKKERNEE